MAYGITNSLDCNGNMPNLYYLVLLVVTSYVILKVTGLLVVRKSVSHQYHNFDVSCTTDFRIFAVGTRDIIEAISSNMQNIEAGYNSIEKNNSIE